MNTLKNSKYQPRIESTKTNTVFNQQYLLQIAAALLLGIIALLPRLIGFGQIPPSISWDEAAVGVNAWSIVHSGTDEWGFKYPATFYSFGDDKNPVHIYLTAVSVAVLGLSEFAVRVPVLILGVLNVILLYFLGSIFFKSKTAGFFAALSLAVSPYSIIFSHFNHELNFTIFFFLAGLLFFYRGISGNGTLLFFAFLCFSIDILTYNSAKVIVPLLVVLLIFLYVRQLWKQKLVVIIGSLIFFGLVSFIFFNPQLSGSARAGQNSFSDDEIKQTEYFKNSKSILLSRVHLTFDQYLNHFSFKYLFRSGDENVRHSPQVFGEFFPVELILIVLGLVMLGLGRSRESIFLLMWILVAPIPSALFKESPHSARAMFMVGSLHLLIGLGAAAVISGMSYLKTVWLKLHFSKFWITVFVFVLISSYYFISLRNFFNFYTGEYAERYAIDWQFGMKEIVEYTKSRSNIERVYMTDSRSQPYIFFRFYNPIANDDFLKTAVLDTSPQSPSNILERYDKYIFGRWDRINSMPTKGIVYVLTPSEYSGLMHRTDFEVKKLVKYPNGSDAYFIVEGNQ